MLGDINFNEGKVKELKMTKIYPYYLPVRQTIFTIEYNDFLIKLR